MRRNLYGMAALASLMILSTSISIAEARGGGGGGGGRGGGGVHSGGYAIGTSSGVHGMGAFHSPVSGVHRGGYPIGTESSGQYASSHVPGTVGNRGGRGYWRNGYGNGWWGAGYGWGGAGWDGDDPGWDGSYPAVSADDDTDVALKEQNQVPPTSGPSMNFATDYPQSTTSTFANYDRDFNTMLNSVPAPMTGTRVSGTFAAPPVARKLPQLRTLASSSAGGAAQFNSGGGMTAQVTAKLQSVQDLLAEYKAGGQLGTFDVGDLQTRLDSIKSRFTAAEKDPEESDTQLGGIFNDLGSLEYDIKSHSN